MAYPSIYAVTYSYTGFQQAQGNNAFPGTQIDADFAALGASTLALSTFTKGVMRADGALNNGIVTYDSLSPALQTSGIAPANAWLTATAYTVGLGVVQSGSLYRCIVAHTSGVFATDLAAGKWLFVASLTSAFTAGANMTLTGNVFSVSISPAFTTPNIGVATATSINGVTIATSTGSLAIANGKTATFSNTMTFTGTDGTSHAFPATSGTVVTSVTPAGGDLAGSYPNPSITVNAVSNAKMAVMPAWTFKGNATGGSAAPTDVTIDGLTLKASPVPADEAIIWDVAGSAWKKVLLSGIAGAGAVSSIAGNVGVFTLSNGIKNVTNDIQADPVFHRSYLAGLTLSTAGASATFGVAAGVAVDSTNAGFMSLASAYTKTTGAWALGTAAGALDTGAIANSTWYHVYLIKRTDTGVVDVLISLNAVTPTLMPTSYTLYRRIGAMKTNGSAQWTAFNQLGDEFLWLASVLDVNAVTLTSATPVLETLTVPPGVQVTARLDVAITNAAQIGGLVNSPDQTAVNSPAFPNMNISNGVAGGAAVAELQVRTNTSAQVRISTATTTAGWSITTQGWTDTRGKNS